jgi:hypothetical protein
MKEKQPRTFLVMVLYITCLINWKRIQHTHLKYWRTLFPTREVHILTASRKPQNKMVRLFVSYYCCLFTNSADLQHVHDTTYRSFEIAYHCFLGSHPITCNAKFRLIRYGFSKITNKPYFPTHTKSVSLSVTDILEWSKESTYNLHISSKQ